MRQTITAVLAAAALALAACGDDDSSDDGGGSTKADFIEQADTICKRVNSSIAEINDQLQSVSGTEEEKLAKLEPIFEDAVRVQDEAIEEFRALEPPAEDEELIDKYLDAAEEQSEVLGKMADAAGSGDAKAFAA